MIALVSAVFAASLHNRGWGDVAVAHGITVVVIVGYAAFAIIRGRRVSKQLPPEDRRWL